MSDYETLKRGCLGWVCEYRDQFAMPPPGDPRFLPLLKPLGELSLTADVLARRSQDPDCAWEIASWCWQQFDEGRLLELVLLEHPDLVAVAAVYQSFAAFGFRNPRFESRLQRTIRLRGVARLEFPAWRALELAQACLALGLDGPWKADESYAATWLAGLPEPWTICESSAYSLTHTVFYRSAFGLQPDAVPAAHREYLTRWLPVWIRYYAGISNFDLVAELVMVCRCITAEDEDDYAALLLTAQESDGMVRGPAGGAALLLDQSDTTALRRRFLDNYHTTLVTLMAAAMAACPVTASEASRLRR